MQRDSGQAALTHGWQGDGCVPTLLCLGPDNLERLGSLKQTNKKANKIPNKNQTRQPNYNKKPKEKGLENFLSFSFLDL